jgi:hypothetical protein
MINTQSGVVSAAVEKIALQSTGSPSEFGQFQRSTNQVFMQGQEFRGRGLAVHVTQDDVLIRFGKGLESCVLVKALDAETRGIALYNNDILSAGDIKAPIAGAAPVVARRDFDNVLTSAPL